MHKPLGKLLLLGFGDINQRLAQLMQKTAHITAARRSRMDVQEIDCQQGDVTESVFVESLLQLNPDQIVVTLSPSEYSEQGYVSTYLRAIEVLTETVSRLGLQPDILFISSSSVYHQDAGEIVNEDSSCEPTGHNGRILLKTEQCLLESATNATIIRFSGIYGPGRYRLIGRSLSDDHSPPPTIHWTNRIHATDCARVIAHLLNVPRNERQSLYLASDQVPVPTHVVRGWIYNQIHQNALYPEFTDAELTPVFANTEATGKRCDPSRLLDSGFTHHFPSYKQGFVPVLAEYRAAQQNQ